MSRKMTKAERIKCHVIIHSASGAAAAVGGGIIPSGTTDSIAISYVQKGMFTALGGVFGRSPEECIAHGCRKTNGARHVGRGAVSALCSCVPVAGNIVKAATAASLTEMIGWQAAHEFARM